MSFRQGFMFVVGATAANAGLKKAKQKIDEYRKRLKEKEEEHQDKITQGDEG